MSRTTPDQIIAHADLIRAVDRLLSEAEAVRRKRHALDRLLSEGEKKPSRPRRRREEADAASR
jgi:hypothetical protein